MYVSYSTMAGNPIARRRAFEAVAHYRYPQDHWRALTTEQQIAAGFGFAISDLNELFAVPFREDDLHNRTLRVRVFEVCMRLGMKYMDLEAKKVAGQALLNELAAALDARQAQSRAEAPDVAPAGGLELGPGASV